MKVNISLSVTKEIVERLDVCRGLVPRSAFVEDIISKAEVLKDARQG